MTRLSINLLGPFQVTLDGKTTPGFEYDKVRALLAYLAVEAGRPHRREALAGLLWPEQPETTARNSLRTALSKLRLAIGDRTAEPPFLHISRETIQFNTGSDYRLDVADFAALLAECEQHRHRRPDTCLACAERQERAATLYRGDFLAGFSLADSAAFEEWTVARREQWHRQALNALHNLAVFYERRGEYGRGYQHAARQIALEPWREEAYRQVMRALAFDGQRSAALAQYETCKQVLAAELGVAPAPETTDFYERIHSGPLGDSPADRRIAGTVPESMTSLVGREKELVALRDLLLDPTCRLLTLTGLGGMGKTRLAQEATLRMELDFPHGAAFVPLASISSKQDVIPAVVDALGFRLSGGRSEQEQLFAFLREKELLLVLDNFEQLLPGTELLVQLMRQAPGLVLLVTSRQRLNLQAEWVFDLLGLDYPAGSIAEEIEKYDSVQLFVQRAQQVVHDFSVSAADVLAVAHICRLCQGMPLAIELAAATVRYQNCPQIAGQLQSNWQALSTTYVDVPERHQSINAVFEHSWALLSPQEQSVLSRLSIFQGGFDHEAAAQVAQSSREELEGLIDKSLLQRKGGGRFDIHPLVRQYAAAKLRQQGRYEETQDRHGAYYLKIAEQIQPLLEESAQAYWLDHLEREHDNLRAALSWARASLQIERGARLAQALCLFWFMRGYLTEGREQLMAFLFLFDAETEPRMRARLLDRAGFLARYQGDYVGAYSLISEGLSICRRLDDSHATADALANLGFVVLRQSDFVQAKAFYAEALTIHRGLNNGQGIADTLSHLALLSYFESDFQTARHDAEESLAIWRDLGDRQGVAWALSIVGKVMFQQDDFVTAGAYFREGLTISREIGFKWGIALSLEGIARVAAVQRRAELALQLAGGADALRQAIGVPLSAVEFAEFEHALAPAYDSLSEQTASNAWDEGRKPDLEELIRRALENVVPISNPR